MLTKLKISRHLTAFFVGIFAVTGSIVAVDAPANAAADLGYNSTVDSALNFNGTSQSASAASAQVIPATGAFTVEAWVNGTSGAPGNATIVSQGTSTAANRFYLKKYTPLNGQSVLIVHRNQSVQAEVTCGVLPNDEWVHVAVALDGTTLNCFINGVNVKTQGFTWGTASVASRLYVGQYAPLPSDAGTYWKGGIDEVKIWNTARTQSEIVSDMHVYGSDDTTTFSSALVAYYDMNEGSGTTLFNRTATSGLNLTTTGSPTFSDVKSTSKANGKDVVTFPRSYLTPVGGWTVPSGISKADILAVAGGGSGGTRHAGGGGAGALSFEAGSTTTPGSALTIQVGQGGLGQLGTGVAPDQSLAVAGAKGQSTVVATLALAGGGGGRGGGQAATSGGSGGGGNSGVGSAAAAGTGSGLKFAGNDGASTNSATSLAGGGGGGAGSAAFAATNSTGSAGGNGLEFSITGTPTCYAAGGGGGSHNSTSAITAAGLGGDGCANSSSSAGAGSRIAAAAATAALPNSGSGGGGGGFDGSNLASGAGGSGIVVIAYAPTDDNYMSLNGTNQWVSTGGKYVIPASGSTTLEGWFFEPVGTTGRRGLISQGKPSNGNDRFEAYVDGGTGSRAVSFFDWNSGNYTVQGSWFPQGQWVHIAFVITSSISNNNSTIATYLNGQLVAVPTTVNKAMTQVIGTDGGFFLGRNSYGNENWWKGGIDQVKVWSAALTDAQVKRSMHTHKDNDGTLISSGLTNLYDFNEAGSDTVVTDRVGSAPLATTGTPSRSSIVSTSTSGANTVYTFPRSFLSAWGGWNVPSGVSKADILTVGGGGAGGLWLGGGGGGGEVDETLATSLTAGTVQQITVGAGGLGGVLEPKSTNDLTPSRLPSDGQTSSFGASISAYGGGRGNSYTADNGATSQRQIGSSGGSSSGPALSSGLQGNPGGSGHFIGTYPAGGGGGAGGPGGNGLHSGTGTAGMGGVGKAVFVSSAATDGKFGGGGGGGTSGSDIYGTSGAPGVGSSGGGNGADPTITAAPSIETIVGGSATGNTGSGGGAAAGRIQTHFKMQSGSGGSGIVVVSVKTKNTVTFDANTGSGSIDSQLITIGSSAAITTNTMIKTGNSFAGWATTSGGNVAYADGASITPTEDLTLYAKWTATVANPVIVSQPSNITKAPGQTATFSVNATASGTASYQWEVSTNTGSTWANVSGGTGATTQSYTTPAVSSSDTLKQYRVNVTNTVSANAATVASSAATLTVGLESIDVNFDELNFDYSNVLHVVGTNGKAVNNKVLFLNVFTRDGIQVDALVTTELLTSATVTNYESGAQAGGANSYFQVDLAILAANGFAQFKFDFYKHGVAGSAGNPCTVANPTCASAVKVSLQNVNVSAIDIDYYQWNDFTQAESYTMAGNTKLKECAIPNSGTCTVRAKPGAFPADMRFQGSADYSRTNDPVDMAIVTYAQIETFSIKFGRSASGNTNYYGVAFKALDWGSTTPQTQGGSAQYVISYNGGSADSGAQAGTHTGAAGATFNILGAGTFVKAGHSFAGWATSSTATTATYAGSAKVTMPGSNLTLYAVWAPIKYTLTYSANGGTAAPAAGSYGSGTSVTLPAGPTRTGYVFGGWDTVINSGTGNVNKPSGDPYSMPSSNTTLYAKWTIADGTLVYNGNVGTTTEANVVAAGSTTTTIATGANTIRSGHDFAGWNSKADGTGTSYAVGSTFTLTATVTNTIYAQWTLSKYNLVFNVNGGVGSPQSQSYVQGATTTMPTNNPTREGYTFGGWNSAANGGGTSYSGSFLMPGNSLTLYAKWNEITYSVTYSNNSAASAGAAGSVSDAATYAAAASVTVKTSTGLTYSGTPSHRFIGWNTAANGSGTDYLVGATLRMPVGGVTLFAQWLDSSVEIVYSGNGGTGAPANDNATIGTRYDISAGTPTRPGYTFDGWILSDSTPSGTYKIGGTEFFSPNDNFETLVAQWTAVNYTVTYNSDSGSTAPAQLTAKHIGDTIDVDSTEPTKSGYTFLGWKDAAGNIYPAGGSFIMGAGNVTLTAQWQGNAYALTYDANGGLGAPITETRNYNAIANLSAVEPTRTGYTFQGWNTLVGGNGTVTALADYQMPSANTTLFAQWDVNNFMLAYNTQSGSTAPSSASQNFDATVTVNANAPTRTGYTFAGWNTVALGTGTTYLPGGTFKMPNANVTLYAQWTKTAFTLYYNTNGGQGVFSSQPIKYSESVIVDSTSPTKVGHIFSGWNTAADGTSGDDYSARVAFTLNVESNVTLYAKWQVDSFSLSYNANEGSGAPVGANHDYDSNVMTASSASVNRATYRFIGWNTRADGSGSGFMEGFTFKMPAENIILYAQWIDASFEIAYNANGGQGGPDGGSADLQSTYTLDSNDPVRPGYAFSGWKLADTTPTNALLKANGSQLNPQLASSFLVTQNELLVAQWVIKTITVTYDLNGGSSNNPPVDGSGNYDANITLASSAGVTRGNFAFVGWSTSPDGTGTTYVDGSSFRLPAENVILYAKWAPIYFIIDYNAAGGTGEPADQFVTPAQTVAIATEEPTKDGYEFEKWTEVSQGTDFVAGSSLIMPSNNVTLVASYTLRAASVPGSGSNSGTDANTGVVDPGEKPIAKPKQLVLSVYFKGDSPVLTASTKLMLRRLAAKAKSYGRANNITIYGRVKETNDKSYDLRLSKARAANVSAYLKKFGVTGVFKVYGKGISPENTAKSRRVDLKLWWSN